MRLIDADDKTLNRKLSYYTCYTGIDEAPYEYATQELDNSPTVPAIPISVIEQIDEEIKLGIDLGDEVVGDYGAKGVVVGIDTYRGEVLLSLLMRNHKVPQLVKASKYKTKTGRHFSQIIEVLEQIKGEADGK